MDERGAFSRGSLTQSVCSTDLVPSVGAARDRLDSPRRAIGRVNIIAAVVSVVDEHGWSEGKEHWNSWNTELLNIYLQVDLML